VPTKFWLILRLLAHSGAGVIKRLEQAQRVMAQHHPSAPHYYLQSIGVRRTSQGLGLGSALLKHTTAICDKAQMPAYLESSTPRNVPLYQRHGFEVIATDAIGDGGPPIFFMWREARQYSSIIAG
jgi:ribosomal protein S18 acetylase RimI-like enzyme